jgi:hypothetical protein
MIWARLIRYFSATGYDQLEAVQRAQALRDLYGMVGDYADGTRA